MPRGYGSSPKLESFQNLKIGVFLGGDSPEREISLRSGRAVYEAIQRQGLSVLYLDPADRETFKARLKNIDVAFVAMHGRGGEDGVLQKILRARDIPYVGSDPVGCLRSFDKEMTKILFRKSAIPTAPYVVVRRSDWEKKLAAFPVPFVVKPLRDGSSLGVFMVENFRGSRAQIAKAIAHYGKLLIEKKIVGREFTVGILGQKALPVIELKPKKAFYDYHAKYTKGMTDYLVPAPIPAKLKGRLQSLASRVHRVLGLRDFSRIDIMVDAEGRPFVLEANAIPGFTELSLLPKAAACAGIPFEGLCLRLLQKACSRRDPKNTKKKG